MLHSWKTTAAGIIAILTGAVYVAAGILEIPVPIIGDSGAAVAAISAGVAALFARDDDAKDEEVIDEK